MVNRGESIPAALLAMFGYFNELLISLILHGWNEQCIFIVIREMSILFSVNCEGSYHFPWKRDQ